MILLLLSHIVIALASIAVGTVGIVRPSYKVLYTSYGLIAATLTTGTALVLMSNSKMLQSCMTGIIYTISVTYMTAITRRKLAMDHIEQ